MQIPKGTGRRRGPVLFTILLASGLGGCTGAPALPPLDPQHPAHPEAAAGPLWTPSIELGRAFADDAETEADHAQPH